MINRTRIKIKHTYLHNKNNEYINKEQQQDEKNTRQYESLKQKLLQHTRTINEQKSHQDRPTKKGKIHDSQTEKQENDNNQILIIGINI